MANDTRTINDGELVLAKVARMGAKRGCAWAYTYYRAKLGTKTGYVFAGRLTSTMFPNRINTELSVQIEAETEYQIVHGRPVAGVNAPSINNLEVTK